MNTTEPKYRHELKYAISSAQIPLLKSRIAPLMKIDPHADSNGFYSIRSLYFDDYYNRCYYENESGTDPREKFRIRIYNHSADRITLECKQKEHGKTHKLACPLTREQAEQLIHGQLPPQSGNMPPLLRRLMLEMQMHRLHPVVVVEYDRIPYVYKNGNVRITFDTQITSSVSISDFFTDTLPKRPIMPTGMHLMEVKFDEFLPDFLYRNLNLGQLQQTAYSKYYLCRKFTLHK